MLTSLSLTWHTACVFALFLYLFHTLTQTAHPFTLLLWSWNSWSEMGALQKLSSPCVGFSGLQRFALSSAADVFMLADSTHRQMGFLPPHTPTYNTQLNKYSSLTQKIVFTLCHLFSHFNRQFYLQQTKILLYCNIGCIVGYLFHWLSRKETILSGYFTHSWNDYLINQLDDRQKGKQQVCKQKCPKCSGSGKC